MLGALGRRRLSRGVSERRRLRGDALACGFTAGFLSGSLPFLTSLCSRGFSGTTATLSAARGLSTLRVATVCRSTGVALVDEVGSLPGVLDQCCEAYQRPAASAATRMKTAVIAPGPNLLPDATIGILMISTSLILVRVLDAGAFVLVDVISASELSLARPIRRNASLKSDALANRSSDLWAIALLNIAAI